MYHSARGNNNNPSRPIREEADEAAGAAGAREGEGNLPTDAGRWLWHEGGQEERPAHPDAT